MKSMLKTVAAMSVLVTLAGCDWSFGWFKKNDEVKHEQAQQGAHHDQQQGHKCSHEGCSHKSHDKHDKKDKHDKHHNVKTQSEDDEDMQPMDDVEVQAADDEDEDEDDAE